MTFIAGRHQFIFFSFPEQTQNVYCVISSNFRTSPSEKKVFNKFYTKLKGRFSNVVQIMLFKSLHKKAWNRLSCYYLQSDPAWCGLNG